jgi:hypothetical protein
MLIQLIISIMIILDVRLSNANLIRKGESIVYFRNSLFDSAIVDDLKRKFLVVFFEITFKKNYIIFLFLFFKEELTCFTCDKSISNDECNRKAIDEPCKITNEDKNSTKTNFACLTIHKFNSVTLETISINKKCSLDCRPDMIGCSSTVIKSNPNNHQHVKVIIFSFFY